jgi:hypothetical protein
VVEEDLTSPLAPVDASASVVTRRPVLAQLARDPTDEHFPLLVYEEETFTDFTFTARFQTVSGAVEQMAGLAFRIQDETNYYVLRASSLGNSFRFYKFVNGERSTPIGVEVDVPRGVWHTLGVECRGNVIRCLLNGRQLIPDLTDNSFGAGRVGFWTKSDSVSWFADARITYTPRESLAAQLVREMMREYPRLIDLEIYGRTRSRPDLHLVASHSGKNAGAAGGKVEEAVLQTEIPYWGKDGSRTSVVVPVRDRNGDPIAAVRFVMETRSGQTEANALARVMPIVKQMENRLRAAKDLTE